MFCPKCGKENPDSNQFCGVCGERTSLNYEQPSKKKEWRKWKFALKIIGLLSIFGGFITLLTIYANPVTELLGLELSLAQLHSYCGVAAINALSGVSCSGVHDLFYFELVIATILIISGLIEVLLS